MSSDHPDFASYSTKELREVLGFIDRQKYPGRVEEILKILAEREHRRLDYADRDAERSRDTKDPLITTVVGTSVKRGRSYSLVAGISSVVFGVLWTLALPAIFGRQPVPPPLPFQLLFYAGGIGTILGGFVGIYNAFARNRFSEYDIVSTADEPDPLAAHLRQSSDEDSGDGKT